MNSLNISFSYFYISNLFFVSWSDVLFGIKEGFLDNTAAIEHAYNIIEKIEKPSQKVLDMAFLNKNESIYPLIEELVNEEKSEDESIVQEKYLFAVLNWVYENQELFSNPLEAVECIYADFNYPEIIKGFVRYASGSFEPDLGSTELNLERLYKKWNNYLKNEKIKWESNT